MKRILFAAFAAALTACSFLDPLPNGTYDEDNFMKYPKIVRGYVDKAYNLLPTSYYSDEFIGLDGATDDMMYTSSTAAMRLFSNGGAQPSSYSLESVWTRDYQAIYYLNLFLKDDLGLNTRYLVYPEENSKLQRCLQGDALGLRAWYLYDLLKFFGGKDSDGKLLGVPFSTEPTDLNKFNASQTTRLSYEDCVKQIVADCDKAYEYLPLGNRDFLVTLSTEMIEGAVRYRALDGAAVKAIKALTLLTWASPAFNPDGDKTRWEEAAKAAKEVIDHKLNIEGAGVVSGGFEPYTAFFWTNPNAPEIYWPSPSFSNTTTFETHFYPEGFNGSASIAPSQELVDAFPMANGYPISDPASGYDKSNPYVGRDPRFYSTIFYNGAQVLRNGLENSIMYEFDTTEGGKDAPGLQSTSLTGYYAKKYISLAWNKNDATVQSNPHPIFFLRWTQMCLAFAEAANHAVGPNASFEGLTAKQALSYIRSRATSDGVTGLGKTADPYLDACAAKGEDAFDKLVKNEWRIETCMEGARFFHLRRWGATAEELNIPVTGVKVTKDATGSLKYSYETIETKSFPSPWLPLPYLDVRKSSGSIKQNNGWESWK